MEKKIVRKNSKKENFLNLLPLGLDAKHKFKPKFYEKFPKEYQATFVLKPLNNALKREWSRLLRIITNEEIYRVTMKVDTLEEARSYDDTDEYELREVLRKSIVNWDNFKTREGESILFEKDADGYLDAELFNLIPNSVIGELTKEINDISLLTDSEVLGLG